MGADKYFKPCQIQTLPSVVLSNVKFPHNVGSILRLSACYGISELCCTGSRIWESVDELDRVPREERLRAYKDVSLMWSMDDLPPLPPEAVPVAIEFRPNSHDLFEFKHPEKAVYIFGPEDGTLGRSILTKCHHFVRIDTMECLNLAVAVGTVLYDRACKENAKRLVTI